MILQGPYATRPGLCAPRRKPTEQPARIDPLDDEHATEYVRWLLEVVDLLHAAARQGQPTPAQRRRLTILGVSRRDVAEWVESARWVHDPPPRGRWDP